MAFDTKKQLEARLLKAGFQQHSKGRWSQLGIYVCGHGEYARPEYSLRCYKDGWSLHATYFFYSGTFGAPVDGRVSDEILYFYTGV
jgi:hypothetical protein